MTRFKRKCKKFNDAKSQSKLKNKSVLLWFVSVIRIFGLPLFFIILPGTVPLLPEKFHGQ